NDTCGGLYKGLQLPNGKVAEEDVAIWAAHYKWCCRSVDSTDIYSFGLYNSWTVLNLTAFPEYWYRSCFSSDGFGFAPVVDVEPTQVRVSWHVDPCGTAYYWFNVFITGPAGVPYWEPYREEQMH